MKKRVYEEYVVNGKRYKIYPNDYLVNHKFTRDEIDAFIEDDDESYNLYASFSVNVWPFIGRNESIQEALQIMSDDPQWYRNVTWTKEQRLEYEQIVYKILMNCLEDDSEEAWQEVDRWLGFGSAPNLDDMSEENYRDLVNKENALRGWRDDEE